MKLKKFKFIINNFNFIDKIEELNKHKFHVITELINYITPTSDVSEKNQKEIIKNLQNAKIKYEFKEYDQFGECLYYESVLKIFNKI